MPSDDSPPKRLMSERVVVRAWNAVDAPLLKDAIDASLEHLRAWMPWAMDEPTPLPDLAARLAKFAADFDEGIDRTYGIFTLDEQRLLGGVGLHARTSPGVLEIGYWIRADAVGRGYATEAAGLVTRAALALPGIERVEIRCDPRNVASAAVPRRLGYRYVTTLIGDAVTPAGEPRDTKVFELHA